MVNETLITPRMVAPTGDPCYFSRTSVYVCVVEFHVQAESAPDGRE
jgi:hypothetical protein